MVGALEYMAQAMNNRTHAAHTLDTHIQPVSMSTEVI